MLIVGIDIWILPFERQKSIWYREKMNFIRIGKSSLIEKNWKGVWKKSEKYSIRSGVIDHNNQVLS